MLTMKELMLSTGESKSTIHYYLKEGLLPVPHKIKANVHSYENDCVNIINFIKHLQNNYSYSISEIKNILKVNNFDFSSSFSHIISSLETMSGSNDNVSYTKEDFLVLADISEEDLAFYENKEFILKRSLGYSNKELQMVNILKKAEELGLDFELFFAYVQKAKELAVLEYKIGASLILEKDAHNSEYELLFDIILSLKPYLFNLQTIKTHKKLILEAEL